LTAAGDILASKTYAEFRRRLVASDCRLCRLCEGRTNLVPDRGNPRARIMVVGEAPGRSEDEQGRSFVGRAGKMLDEILAGAGLDTEKDVLISNAVKCRPPDNRRPKPDEIEACRPFLEKQIGLVKPEVIVLLGSTALACLAPGSKGPLGERVGRWLELPRHPGVKFFVTYHPAAVFYNRRLKTDMEEHARMLKEHLEK
jgi:uracil-DNA glycosylase